MVLILVGLLIFFPLGTSRASAERLRLAILPVKESADLETSWLKYAYPEFLSEALGETGLVEVVGFDEVYKTIQQMREGTQDLDAWKNSPLVTSMGVNALLQVEIQTERELMNFTVSLAQNDSVTSFSFKTSDPPSTIQTVIGPAFTKPCDRGKGPRRPRG